MSTSTTATRTTIADRQAAVPDAYLDCRTLGHRWRLNKKDSFRSEYGKTINLRCGDCGTKRHDVFTHYGRLNFRTYDYPDNYYIDPGLTPTRAELRDRFYNERIASGD